MNCYSIPPSESFLRCLAEWVLAEYGHDAALLTRALILLPGRRACRSLREIFLDITDGKPMLLPRIQPIGDIEDNNFLVAYASDMLPPVHPLRRQLLLMQLVNNFEKHRQGRVYNMEKTAQLAEQLASLLDDVAREDLDFSGLENIVPSELQKHWQQTLDFLKIVSLHWPQMLKNESASDVIAYRNHLLDNISAALLSEPPDFPIIAAGSTGSQPATARLIATIAKLPTGKVILPMLDKQLSEDEWKSLDETHPQYMLKKLLEKIGSKRSEVKDLSSAKDNERESCLREIFKPSVATAQWKNSTCDFNTGLSGIHLVHADTLLDEARSVAVILRNTLNTEGKTAAFITPNRALAKMVSSQMQRFGVVVDDSAGRNLKDAPSAIFLRLVLDVVRSGISPAALLALLRHPMAAAGVSAAICRQFASMLERQFLRGIRNEAGLSGLVDAARAEKLEELATWLSGIEKQLRPLANIFHTKQATFKQLLQAHIEFSEWLATEPDNDKQVLWAKESGQQLAGWLAELLEHSDVMPDMNPAIYPATFDALLSMQSYWPKFSQHPRLHILSPIEARLQKFDCVILGGLTEKSWPSSVEADPWMSRPMRKAFGLPATETAIGQAAQDVFNHCHADKVWLTRSRKSDGTPTVDSRWLVRLETLVSQKSPETLARMNTHTIDAALAYLDAPADIAAIDAPKATPPAHARPTRMRATDIDKWLTDPYYIYAKYILKLRQLDELDKDPDGADLGNLIHKALELFVRDHPKTLPDNAHEKLLDYGKKVFAAFAHQPAVQCLWWPRFETVAEWFLEQEASRRASFVEVLSEVQGEWHFSIDDRSFTLVARIDRLEATKNGRVNIVDYKTGGLPNSKDISAGLGNQLYVAAMIAKHGKLLPTPQGAIDKDFQLEYWKLAAKKSASEIFDVPFSDDILAGREEMLKGLITTYMDEKQPYAVPQDNQRELSYNEYEHLVRKAEWESV